jgi:hypothetical protein
VSRSNIAGYSPFGPLKGEDSPKLSLAIAGRGSIFQPCFNCGPYGFETALSHMIVVYTPLSYLVDASQERLTIGLQSHILGVYAKYMTLKAQLSELGSWRVSHSFQFSGAPIPLLRLRRRRWALPPHSPGQARTPPLAARTGSPSPAPPTTPEGPSFSWAAEAWAEGPFRAAAGRSGGAAGTTELPSRVRRLKPPDGKGGGCLRPS